MRFCGLLLTLTIGLTLVSCNRDDHRDESTARQAGRDAARAVDEAKRDVKHAEEDIRKAGKEAREGWNEEKRSADRKDKR
jgi:hypothetical protein